MITKKAFAKINISLSLGEKRADGYHDIDTIMQTIALSDEISVDLSNADEFTINGKYSELPLDENNIIKKTLTLFREYTGIEQNFKIRLTKNIPFGAGLAGGSSDAFTALRIFSQICEINFSKSDFLVLAEKLGSDVPFFFYGGTVRATGRGEILEVLPPLEHLHVLIVKPNFNISTAKAYSLWDEFKEAKIFSEQHTSTKLHNTSCCIDTKTNKKILNNTDFLNDKNKHYNNNYLKNEDESLHLFHNDFETVLFPVYPQLAEIKNNLMSCGASQALLTGSGSCVFGFFKQKEKAQKVLSEKALLRLGDLILTETNELDLK